MGAGHAYGYPHFMLIDEDQLDEDQGLAELEGYIKNYLDKKDTWHTGLSMGIYAGKDAEIIAHNYDIVFGFDCGGGSPCVFASRYEWDGRSEEVVDPSDYAVVEEVFNHLISQCPLMFRLACGPWLSTPVISKYEVK